MKIEICRRVAWGGAVALSITGMSGDELVKNALIDFAAENFEIACYQALMVAAEELGDAATADICRETLHDEQQMTQFLNANLPTVVRETLHVSAT